MGVYRPITHEHGDLYEPIGEAEAQVAVHEARANPHPQYAAADHVHDGSGTHNHDGTYEASGAVADHAAATDPHGQYVQEVGGTLRGYREPGLTLPTSGTVTLDFSTHNIWEINPTGAVTVAFAGLPAAGVHASGTLIVRNAGHAITWPVGTQHPGGTAPVLDGKTYLSLVVEADGTVVVGRAWSGVA